VRVSVLDGATDLVVDSQCQEALQLLKPRVEGVLGDQKKRILLDLAIWPRRNTCDRWCIVEDALPASFVFILCAFLDFWDFGVPFTDVESTNQHRSNRSWQV